MIWVNVKKYLGHNELGNEGVQELIKALTMNYELEVLKICKLLYILDGNVIDSKTKELISKDKRMLI